MESHSVQVPRSVILATWLDRLAVHDAALLDAVRAVRGDDEPHTITGPARDGLVAITEPTGDDELASLLAGLSGRAEAGTGLTVVACLPVPGDAGGVPVEVNHRATDAGECVLLSAGGRSWALVPEVEEFGSAFETGHLVAWWCNEVTPWETRVLGAIGSLADAERSLRGALVTATEALVDLDVARWRDDVATHLDGLRGGELGWPLPPRLDARRVRALSLALRLQAIVGLATADDGGAVNLWQADQRSAALAQVERAARHATAAATFVH